MTCRRSPRRRSAGGNYHRQLPGMATQRAGGNRTRGLYNPASDVARYEEHFPILQTRTTADAGSQSTDASEIAGQAQTTTAQRIHGGLLPTPGVQIKHKLTQVNTLVNKIATLVRDFRN